MGDTNHGSDSISPFNISPRRTGRIIDWLRLVRIANWPSIVGNIIASATIVASDEIWNLPFLVLILLVSMALFGAGMALNDWNDAIADAKDRPQRPIPSGAMGRNAALILVFTLMTCALIGAMIIDWRSADANRPLGVTTGITLAICLSIWLYDVLFKRVPLGAFFMGTCRGLNLWLGASILAIGWTRFSAPPMSALLLYSIALTVYVTGVTLIAKNEADSQSPNRWMPLGLIMVFGALGIHALAPTILLPLLGIHTIHYTIAATAMPIFLICRLAFRAKRWMNSRDQMVHRSMIILALQGIVVLDATACLVWDDGRLGAACLVLAMLPTSLLLSRIRSLT
ncbi:MAG: UbiA family prenyltransferase [Pirellulaceae bacterium]